MQIEHKFNLLIKLLELEKSVFAKSEKKIKLKPKINKKLKQKEHRMMLNSCISLIKPF